jgi:hypothetical protein
MLVRKLEGKRPLERHRCRWKYNIKMDLKENVCVDCIKLVQDRVQ